MFQAPKHVLVALFWLPTVLCAAIPRGIDSIERFNSSDRSIAIRVLLAKGVREIRLRSDDPQAKIQIAGKWFKLPAFVRIRSDRGKNYFEANGQRIRHKILRIQGLYRNSALQYAGRFYHGALWLHQTGSAFTVVNRVSLEDYLAGTLGSEMSSSWEMDALKAQAVVSRSYVLHRLKQPRHELYDVQSSVADQVYGGLATETPRTREAVRATSGLYLSYSGKPMKTYFHSRCGGTTARPEQVWQAREPGQSKNIPCPYCRRYPLNWSVELPETELKQIFKIDASARYRFESIRAPSGRVTDLELWSDEKPTRLRSNQFRARVGYARLKSTLFEWTHTPGKIRFRGKGQGHGVGMCQWGARYLAQSGLPFKAILSHYYPQSRLDVL
ncbi:MAG: SpoIID/LytB domain-containing protein [Bdellovibrionales bacterium]|nr:SpoIID/LytB domain-containing protein [Bdellovibrionales bacterium]